MKMILAIKNNNLEEKIINKYYSKYEIYIASNKTMIKKLLCSNCILIIRDEVININEIERFIISIKEKYNKIQIIIIVKKLNQELKEFLFSKEVFNIIEGTSFSFNCLAEMIDKPKMVVYKDKKTNENSNVVIVTGGFSTGKSTISRLLAMYIARDSKVLLIDMNYTHPTIDLYVNSGRNYAIEELVNDIEQNDYIDINKYITNDERIINLKYILNKGNTCIPRDNIIIKIIEIAKKYFEYVIIDTSSFMITKVYNISQKNNYNLIHIIEPNIRGIKNYMEDIKYIDKTYIQSSIIILNKYINLLKINRFEKRYKFRNSIPLKLSFILIYTNKLSLFIFYASIRKIVKKIKAKDKKNFINFNNRRNKHE